MEIFHQQYGIMFAFFSFMRVIWTIAHENCTPWWTGKLNRLCKMTMENEGISRSGQGILIRLSVSWFGNFFFFPSSFSFFSPLRHALTTWSNSNCLLEWEECHRLFQCFVAGSIEEKFANEGDFPHLLPLKEGGEEISLILIFLFIFHTNTTEKDPSQCRIPPRMQWCLSFVHIVMLEGAAQRNSSEKRS